MKRTNWLLVAFLLINAIGCYADGNGVLYVSPKGCLLYTSDAADEL